MKKTNIKGYKIDFATNTLTMNYKFASAAKQYGSAEYELIKQIQSDFPILKIITKAGRNITTARPTKRMTYANMERYIKVYDNADELLEIFYKVKEMSKTLISPYKYVYDWFVSQFPKYKELPEKIEAKLRITPVAAPDIENYKSKLDKAS
ncbi:MAG: hypothetical protein IKW59_04365 [Clostridia bacterium]|nr:hypothetical protein [Clostridia bacterium]